MAIIKHLVINVLAFQFTVCVWFITALITNLIAIQLTGSSPVEADYIWVLAFFIALSEYFVRSLKR